MSSFVCPSLIMRVWSAYYWYFDHLSPNFFPSQVFVGKPVTFRSNKILALKLGIRALLLLLLLEKGKWFSCRFCLRQNLFEMSDCMSADGDHRNHSVTCFFSFDFSIFMKRIPNQTRPRTEPNHNIWFCSFQLFNFLSGLAHPLKYGIFKKKKTTQWQRTSEQQSKSGWWV